MNDEVNDILHHMVHSVRQLSRMLEADRHITVQMSDMIQSIPGSSEPFNNQEALLEHSNIVFKSITAYLNSIAGLEHTVAQQLSYAVQALKEQEDYGE